MAMITFPVPSTTTSRFAVAARNVPHDLDALLRQNPVAPYQTHIAGRLGSPQLQVTREDLTCLLWDPARIRAHRPEDRLAARFFANAAQFATVTAFAPVTDQPRCVQVARSAAYAIAAATDGIAADLVTGQLLTRPTTERERFVLADHWIGDVLPPFRANGRCTAPEPELDPEGVNGCTCVRLRTRGLRRFGLPELQMTDIACPHDLAALNVLRTTARRLLTDHWSWLATGPTANTRTIPATLHLTQTDFNNFWGAHRPHPQAPPFEVTLTLTTPTLLTVSPPPTFTGTTNDWLWSNTLPPDLYDLLMAHPTPQAA